MQRFLYSSINRRGLRLNYAQGHRYIPAYCVLIAVSGCEGPDEAEGRLVFELLTDLTSFVCRGYFGDSGLVPVAL